MDQDYLQNIAASPHVEEGAFDRAISRGMSGAQRFSAMTGGQLTDLNYTKIKSLFATFQKRVTSILKDFDDVGTRLEQMQPRPTPQQLDIINQLKGLYGILVPSKFQQHQLGQLSPPNASRTGLTEIVEGFFNRDLSLNKALQTNKPDEILNAYLSQLKKAYSSFINDAVKVTNYPKDFVARVVGNINPQYGKILNATKKVVETPIQAAPGAVPPVIPGAPAAPAETPPPTAEPSGAPNPAAASGAASSGGASGAVAPTGALKNAASLGGSGNDFAIIVGHVIDVIVSNVAEDTARSEPYFTQTLPTTYDEPSLHAKPPPKPKPAPGPSKPKATPPPAPSGVEDYSIEEADVEDDEENDAEAEPKGQPDSHTGFQDEPGKFLYNFAGRYDKAKNFAIELSNKGKESVTLSKNKVKNLRIIWVNRTHENTIHVKYQDAGEVTPGKPTPWKEIVLFKFFDNQVNPRSLSYAGGKNSIYTFLHEANPYETNLLKGASKEVLQDLESKENIFMRALYAVIDRKSMEFKGMPKGALDMVVHEDGSVSIYNNPNYKESPYDKTKIKALINSTDDKEKSLWRNSLEHFGYFDKFPDMKPVASENVQDAIEILMTHQHAKPDAEELVQRAINEIGKAAMNMTGEELVYYIQNNLGKHPAKVKAPGVTTTGNTTDASKTKKVSDIPAAIDAAKALSSMGSGKTKISDEEATKLVQMVVDKYGDALSMQDYFKYAKASPSEPTTTGTETPAKPVGDPPAAAPTPTPVSKPASEPPKTPEPDKDKKDEPNVGSAKFNDKGAVEWTKPDGTVRKLTAKQINNMSAPRLKAALKKAGYPFEKFGVTNLKETVGGFINPFNPTNFL